MINAIRWVRAYSPPTAPTPPWHIAGAGNLLNRFTTCGQKVPAHTEIQRKTVSDDAVCPACMGEPPQTIAIINRRRRSISSPVIADALARFKRKGGKIETLPRVPDIQRRTSNLGTDGWLDPMDNLQAF